MAGEAPEPERHRRARSHKRPPVPRTVVSALTGADGLLKPVWGDPGAASPPACRRTQPADTRQRRMARRAVGLPQSLAVKTGRGSDTSADMISFSDCIDDAGLRRLGAEIIAAAIEEARHVEPVRKASPDAAERTRRATAKRLAAEGFIRGEGLIRCLEVFGVKMDPEAIRSRVLPPSPEQERARILALPPLRFR